VTYAEALMEFKRAYWRAVLVETGGNVTQAAKIAGLYRQTTHAILRRLGIRNPVRRKLRGNWGDLPSDAAHSQRGERNAAADQRL
jgi:DNA-binding protein Fis